MIEQFEIRNYRSCIHTNIKFQPDLSVLIGPNGSGKTNILHAILLLKKLIAIHAPSELKPKLLDQTNIKAVFKIRGKEATLSSKMQLDTNESNNDVIIGCAESWSSSAFKGVRINLPVTLALAKNFGRFVFDKEKVAAGFLELLDNVSEFASNIKYYSATQFTNPSKCPVSIEIEAGGYVVSGKSFKGHGKFIFDLYSTSRAKNSNYGEFLEVIGPEGIGLISDIEFEEIPTSSVDYSVQSGGKVQKKKRKKSIIVPRFTIGQNALSPNQLSEGTFKTITLLFYLITEKSSALLLEEPEVCVHHGLLASIVDLIKTYSKQKQIILSTHSDFVLDKIEPHHVYKVVRDDNLGTKVTRLTDSMSSKELAALKDYLETEGNLGEYWKHGGLEEVY